MTKRRSIVGNVRTGPPRVNRRDLEAAFRRLRYDDNSLPEEYRAPLIERFVEDLAAMATPDVVEPSRDATFKQLLKVKDDGIKLLSSIWSLQERAVDAVYDARQEHGGPTLGELAGWLQELVNDADTAAANVAKLNRDRPGPKRKVQARRIANTAAIQFVRLTARPPARVNDKGDGKMKPSSEFSAFLTEIFCALDVRADVDERGKEAIVHWKARNIGSFEERFPDVMRIELP